MEKCEASYAMDAGIYVGQSTNVVVRDNYVHNNVAGLEIENTRNGEVYNNVAKMDGNNGENFAPKGMIVSTLPPGTGMNLMSHSNIEMHDNVIKNHKTVSVMINSWFITGNPFKSEEFPSDMSTEAGQLISFITDGKGVDILMDGIFKPGLPDINGNASSYCIRNNGADLTFINLNAGLGASPEEMKKNMDTNFAKFDCELPNFDTSEHDKWLAVK